MTFRKVFRYLFATMLVFIAGMAAYEYGFQSWSSAVGIPVLLLIASIVGCGPELYEGVSFHLPGDTAIDFGGNEECDHDQ